MFNLYLICIDDLQNISNIEVTLMASKTDKVTNEIIKKRKYVLLKIKNGINNIHLLINITRDIIFSRRWNKMEQYNEEELTLIHSNRPIEKIDVNLIKSIETKMHLNKEYDNLIDFYNTIYDFSNFSFKNVADCLIKNENKDCIAHFLENEDSLYFFTKEDINKLKKYLNAMEVNIKLNKDYDYYYKLLFKKGVRPYTKPTINNYMKIYFFSRYNKSFKLKLIDVKNEELFVSYINYYNYKLLKEEQLFYAINYINEFGFNIDINAKSVSLEEA